uniref:SFRICE_010029 n=1 Tax=Spodoptera frugiperda TaxID=7108 RepID=A0A2H1W9E9_SPOFR
MKISYFQKSDLVFFMNGVKTLTANKNLVKANPSLMPPMAFNVLNDSLGLFDLTARLVRWLGNWLPRNGHLPIPNEEGDMVDVLDAAAEAGGVQHGVEVAERGAALLVPLLPDRSTRRPPQLELIRVNTSKMLRGGAKHMSSGSLSCAACCFSTCLRGTRGLCSGGVGANVPNRCPTTGTSRGNVNCQNWGFSCWKRNRATTPLINYKINDVLTICLASSCRSYVLTLQLTATEHRTVMSLAARITRESRYSSPGHMGEDHPMYSLARAKREGVSDSY